MLLGALVGFAEVRQLRPGFNLFSVRQDVELGEEATRELTKEMAVVRNRDLDAYLGVILGKLEKSKYARTLNSGSSRDAIFPFSIHVVADKKINAFSLPGGPLFVNTGAITAADNEAQLAGVIAHEMSHVALRHMTNQASKRELVALPAILASSLTGHSLLGELTRIGIGLGANSALLKFSRTDEAEADYNGTEMMADTGYNPIELARFFEKLEEKAGRAGGIEQFLSDHPDPGNRIAAISAEVRELPRRTYVDDETGRFLQVRDAVRHVAVPTRAEHEEIPQPSTERLTFEGQSYSLRYPDNWQVQRGDKPDAVTIGPHGGVLPEAVGYGLQVNYLKGDSDALIRSLKKSNADMRLTGEVRSIEVGGQPGMLNTLASKSPYGGEEKDVLVTVARPEGLFYIVFIAPKGEFDKAQGTFEDVLKSLQFR
jgi:beta-barrel assembly-enhancing protease